ncbi:hypothetical protein [Legionella sp. WA2022007384]
MQQKFDEATMKYGPDFNLFLAIQGKFYSILDDIKATADPGFIAHCLGECQKILSMGSDMTRMDAMHTSTFSDPDSSMATTSLITPANNIQPSNTPAKKRKHSEIIDSRTDVGNGLPLVQQPNFEPGDSFALTKRHKAVYPHLEPAEKGKEKDAAQAITPTRVRPTQGKIVRKLISPFLNEYIEQMAKGDLKEYEKVQREMIQKNERYNKHLSMRHISSIGQRSDLKKEIKPKAPDELKNKFIYSHHISFPFTVKKSDHSLRRSTRYQNVKSRSEFISKEIIPYIKTSPSMAAQNLIYLYQHHLMYSIYLKRKSGEQLGEILIFHMNKLGLCLEKKEIKSLKSAINTSYDLIKRKKPFKDLIMRTSMLQNELPVEKSQDKTSDGTLIATMVLHENLVKPIKTNDTFDQPFCNSLKITQDTNFYDVKGKLIGVYRIGAIQPQLITDKLRKELSSTTRTQLNRMGAVSSEETANNKQNKENVQRNVRSAPIGILGKKVTRIRPTQFSEAKFGVEEGLAPLFKTVEQIYAECAPVEYAARRQLMGYATNFTINGSSYLLTAEANYDKQTNAHVDNNKFPIHCLNPLFVIYPSSNQQQGDLQRTYEGAYTFFPGVKGALPNDTQSFFEGIYFDLKEGDLLFWNFDKYFHCNTKLTPSNGITDSNWHRISIVGFTKGEALLKMVEPLVLEDSDDEDSALFSSEELTHYEQRSEDFLFETSQSLQIKEQPLSKDEYDEGSFSYVEEEETIDGMKLMSLDSLLSSDNIIELEMPNDQVEEYPGLNNSTGYVAAQKGEGQPTGYYAKTNPLNLTFFRAEKSSLGNEALKSVQTIQHN